MINNKLEKFPLSYFENKTILITGAGGTIGSALVKQLSNAKIIAADSSEYAIYKLKRETKGNIKFVLGDLCNEDLVQDIFDAYPIDMVIHCAAYKHVDLLEDELTRKNSIRNNVIPLKNILRQHPNNVILLSTDKAVEPVNVLGLSKKMAEDMLAAHATIFYGSFKTIRFGNVYGSSGSFVETMLYQQLNGKPITLTDKNMKRFFITKEDAVNMILETSTYEENGTYVLNSGMEMKIVDTLPSDMDVVEVGMRPGERLREKLHSGNEELLDTGNKWIKRIEWDARQ